LVDPFWRPFNFSEVPEGSLVDHYVPVFALPFGAKLLVTENRFELQGAKDCFELRPVFDFGFRFNPDFV